MNLYAYCHNDPINNIDPSGLTVYQLNNEVAGGQYHTFLLLVPDDHAAFAGNQAMKWYRMPDGNGGSMPVLGIILRAGPEFDNLFNWGKLTARKNFRDVPMESPIVDIVPNPYGNSKGNDTCFITKILETNDQYQENSSNPGYTLPLGTKKPFIGLLRLPFPRILVPTLMWRQEYNSNSFISGLLQASGANPIQPNLSVPMYNTPVPEAYFW